MTVLVSLAMLSPTTLQPRLTDGDGMPDAWNEGYTEADSITGLVLDPYPTQTPDALDVDEDGVTDVAEAELGTDPNDADSDDDGFMMVKRWRQD